MTAIDVNTPATLKWISREIQHERPFLRLKDAVRFAMHDLRKADFFTARVLTGDRVFQGDEIVELFQRGGIAVRRFAPF